MFPEDQLDIATITESTVVPAIYQSDQSATIIPAIYQSDQSATIIPALTVIPAKAGIHSGATAQSAYRISERKPK